MTKTITREQLAAALAEVGGRLGEEVPNLYASYIFDALPASPSLDVERLRLRFLSLLTLDSETTDRRRRDFNRAIFNPEKGWAVFNGTDLAMVMDKFDKAAAYEKAAMTDLRTLAEKATAGPWTAGGKNTDTSGFYFVVSGPEWWVGEVRDEPDAAYIAAANPTAIIALLDERDALRASVETAIAYIDAERSRLRAIPNPTHTNTVKQEYLNDLDHALCPYDLDSLQPDGWHEIEGEPVNRCCGQYLDSGECCASIYGEARLVPEQTEPQRVKCAGVSE